MRAYLAAPCRRITAFAAWVEHRRLRLLHQRFHCLHRPYRWPRPARSIQTPLADLARSGSSELLPLLRRRSTCHASPRLRDASARLHQRLAPSISNRPARSNRAAWRLHRQCALPAAQLHASGQRSSSPALRGCPALSGARSGTRLVCRASFVSHRIKRGAPQLARCGQRSSAPALRGCPALSGARSGAPALRGCPALSGARSGAPALRGCPALSGARSGTRLVRRTSLVSHRIQRGASQFVRCTQLFRRAPSKRVRRAQLSR
jgi:hypothetical protein